MNASVLDDARIAEATDRHGPVAPAAWLGVLCATKLQRQAGRVKLPAVVLARTIGAQRKDAASALETFVEFGLLVHAGGDEYDVPRWIDLQPDDRGGVARAARKALHPDRKPGRPRNAR